MSSRSLVALVALSLGLLLFACGDDDGDTTPTPDSGPTDGGALDVFVPMPDAAPDAADDAGRDAAPPPCPADVSSTLDGVRIEMPDQPCTFTLAEAAAGIDFLYDVVVDSQVDGVTYTRGCFEPGPSGLVTSEVVAGGGQRYCVCDVGLCMSTMEMRDLPAGAHRSTFHWEGRNWEGPSDTGMPMGPAFPVGDYTLEITSSGMHAGTSFELRTRFPVHLVP